MTNVVNELIFKQYFINLEKNKNIRPETIEKLKKIYSDGNISNVDVLSKLIQEMEVSYAKDQKNLDK